MRRIPDGLLDQLDPLRNRQQRGLARVVHDDHVQLVEDPGGLLDHVEMTQE